MYATRNTEDLFSKYIKYITKEKIIGAVLILATERYSELKKVK